MNQPEIDVNISLVDQRLNGWNFDEKLSRLFLDKSGEIEEQISPLYLAILKNNIDIIELLLNQQKIDVNMKSMIRENWYANDMLLRTALHASVINKQIKIIKMLLQHKNIDMNIVDEKGKKPIDYTEDEIIKELF